MPVTSRMICVVILLGATIATGQDLSVMTFNVRFDNPGDSLDRWDLRKGDIVDFIGKTQPAILGTQEGKHHQVEFMDQNLDNYTYVGVGRDHGTEAGEYCALFFDTTAVRLEESGSFWLSETGDTSSVGWDAAITRICTYARFRHANGEVFYVFNGHFDHVGALARENSARQIIDSVDVQRDKGFKVVLLGDFNSEPETKAFQVMDASMECGWRNKPSWPIGPKGTFTGFDTTREPTRHIDHIFTSGFEVLSYQHLDPRSRTGRGLSDHLPVRAELRFK